ncbi:MAG: preprotein translocase subunit SecG [Reichenbachiella sp.]
MFATVIVFIVIVAVLLVLVILAQNSKGGGLSSQFGGAGTSQIMGVKKTGDLLEKITWGLAIGLIALTLSTKFLISNDSGAGFTSPNVESAQEKVVSPALDTPPLPGTESADEDQEEETTEE